MMPSQATRLVRHWHGMLGHLARLARDRRGGPAMEFALIGPVLAVCLVFGYDLGNALQQHIRMREAVRAGGLYAVSFPTDFTGAMSAISAAVPDWNASNEGFSVKAVSWNCYCWTSVSNTSSVINCAGSCSTSTQELQRFVSFSATKSFSALFLTNITLISVNHVARVQ